MGNRAVLYRWFWGVKWVCGLKVKEQRKRPVHRWLGGGGVVSCLVVPARRRRLDLFSRGR